MSTQAPAIRPATEADIGGILECLRAAFSSHQDRYSPAAFQDTVLDATSLRERLAVMTVLVAEGPAGEIAGTIACRVVEPGHGHLRGMAVRPDRQGSGLAERLLDAAEAELRAAGCSRVTLDTTAPLARAVRFYERRGFRRTGRVGDYFGMPLFEYEKTLGPG